MSRKLIRVENNTKKESRGVTLSVKQKELFKEYLALNNIQQTEVLNNIIFDFVNLVSNSTFDNMSKISQKYTGSFVYSSEDTLTTITFRIENDLYFKFCNISLSMGNDPTVMVRKLLLEELGYPFHTHTLAELELDLYYSSMLNETGKYIENINKVS